MLVSDIRYQISDIRYQISDIRYQISDNMDLMWKYKQIITKAA